MSTISKEMAYIFRITHIENVPWILQNGIHCRNSNVRDPNFRAIGDPELIAKRSSRQVPVGLGGTLSDYVPFYFTPFSPMLYKIKTGHGVQCIRMSEIVLIVSSIPKLVETSTSFVFTDRHAYLQTAKFLTRTSDLDQINWHLIASRNFQRDPNDPERVERYQAEALVYRHIPITALLGIACNSSLAETRLREMLATARVSLTTAVKPDWYFK